MCILKIKCQKIKTPASLLHILVFWRSGHATHESIHCQVLSGTGLEFLPLPLKVDTPFLPNPSFPTF